MKLLRTGVLSFLVLGLGCSDSVKPEDTWKLDEEQNGFDCLSKTCEGSFIHCLRAEPSKDQTMAFVVRNVCDDEIYFDPYRIVKAPEMLRPTPRFHIGGEFQFSPAGPQIAVNEAWPFGAQEESEILIPNGDLFACDDELGRGFSASVLIDSFSVQVLFPEPLPNKEAFEPDLEYRDFRLCRDLVEDVTRDHGWITSRRSIELTWEGLKLVRAKE